MMFEVHLPGALDCFRHPFLAGMILVKPVTRCLTQNL